MATHGVHPVHHHHRASGLLAIRMLLWRSDPPPWATQYTHEGLIGHYHLDRYGDLAASGPLPVHPVQLYESLGTLLLLLGVMRLKSHIGELSAASVLGGGYLALYAILNPLRAYLNTESSLVFWGPLSQLQWVLLTLSCVALYLAKRSRHTQKLNQISAPISLELSAKKALLLWSVLTGCGAVSLYLGTPFSAQLSALGMCLTTVALVHSLPQGDWLVSYTVLGLDSVSLNRAFRSALLLLTIPFCLMPLVLLGTATPNDPLTMSSPRAWVYQLESTQQKLVRIGQGRQIIKPMTSFEVYNMEDEEVINIERDPPRKAKKTGRWIIQGGLVNGEVNYEECIRGCRACSGDNVYVQQKQKNQLHHASVAYKQPLKGDFIGQVHGAWFHERINGERTSNDLNFIINPRGKVDVMHLGLGYDLFNDFFRVGIGLRYNWGAVDGHFAKRVNEVVPDYVLALGYKYIFIEGGTGIFWGSPATGGSLFGLRLEGDITDQFGYLLRLGTSTLGPLHEVFSPLIQVGIRVPHIQISLTGGEFKGVNLGAVF